MKKHLKILFAVALSIFTWNITHAQEIFGPGLGEFTYTGYEPLSDKPVTVHYFIPKGDVTQMPVLFAMHGSERNGKRTLEAWRYFADRDGFIVICPQYSREYYSVNEYRYGGVSENSKGYYPVPKEKWTFNTIEALFDLFREDTGNTNEKYDIWGHSAGGQFVHRFLLCMPEARADKAVAANCGVWTFTLPEGLVDKKGETRTWPYSVMGTPFAEEENLKKYFAHNLYVSLGMKDTDTSKDDFPNSPAAQAEGLNRYERGTNFYKTAKKEAKKIKADFNWKKVDVQDSAHSIKGMVYGTYQSVNGKKTYSIDDITKTGGYWLIYGNRN